MQLLYNVCQRSLSSVARQPWTAMLPFCSLVPWKPVCFQTIMLGFDIWIGTTEYLQVKHLGVSVWWMKDTHSYFITSDTALQKFLSLSVDAVAPGCFKKQVWVEKNNPEVLLALDTTVFLQWLTVRAHCDFQLCLSLSSPVAIARCYLKSLFLCSNVLLLACIHTHTVSQ